MLNRKETRKVLVEWKGFLSEAKKEISNNITVRLFDFDGTLFSHPDSDVNKILSNPFMAATLNEKVLEKLMEECEVTPSLKSLVSGKKSPNVKNYIISKVSSTGFGPSRAEIINGLQNQSDANYVSLKNVISRFDKNIDADLQSNNTKKLSKVLNLGNLETDPDSHKIHTEHVVNAQKDKIEKFLDTFKDNIEEVFVVTNLAVSFEDEKTGKIIRVPGTANKGQKAQELVKMLMDQNPGKHFKFEIYDNNTVNIANVTDGILLADNHIPNLKYNSVKEKQLIYGLYEKMQRSPNVEIQKTLATRGDGGIETQDVTNRYFTKSKSNPPNTQRRFETIKNDIVDLTNYYAMRGKATGRPHLEDRKKMVDYLTTHNFPLIAEIVDNPKGATELSTKYTDSDENLSKFLDQVCDWLFNIQNFKDSMNFTFDSSEPVEQDTESPLAKSRSKKLTKSMSLNEPTTPEEPIQSVEEPVNPTEVPSSEVEEPQEFTKLTESLNKLRLVLKKR